MTGSNELSPESNLAAASSTKAPPVDNLDAYRSPSLQAPTADSPKPSALDVTKKVEALLDNDIPRLNKAHDLDGAKKVYEAAIALAKTLTPEDIAKAQKELTAVRSQEALEKDPIKQRELAEKETHLFTLTRLKDATLGNMALWYYRQGQTEAGNEKLIEATGIDAAKAHDLRKLGPDEIKKFGDALASSSLSPILGDQNFFRHMQGVGGPDHPVPEIFNQMHNLVVSKNNESHPGTTGGADASVLVGFQKVADALTEKPAAPTKDQRAVLDAGIKTYDGQSAALLTQLQAGQDALDKLLPRDKQEAYNAATSAVDTQLQKIMDANGGKLPADLNANISAVLSQSSPDAFAKASADLAKSNPELSQALIKAQSIIPSGPQGAAVMDALQKNDDNQSAFIQAAQQSFKAHMMYANILLKSSNPPAEADLIQARQLYGDAFKSIPDAMAAQYQAAPEIKQLASALQIDDKGVTHDKTKVGDTSTVAVSASAAQGAEANTLAALSADKLQERLKDGMAKGQAGLAETSAIFEELSKRTQNPEQMKAITTEINANLAMLQSGKDESGKALDAADRLKLHQSNAEDLAALNMHASVEHAYALYLGDNRLQAAGDHDLLSGKVEERGNANLQDQNNQIKAMDTHQRLAIAAADGVDLDLIKRVGAAVNQDRQAGIVDPASLNAIKVSIEGDAGATGAKNYGMLNLRVRLRDELAGTYLMEGFNALGPDGKIDSTKISGTDEMFKPQLALQLLNEATAVSQKINGAGSHDAETEQMLSLGHAVSPEIFKANHDKAVSDSAGIVSNMAAFAASAAGSTILKVALTTLTEGRINPMAANALANATAIGTGTLTRHVVHGIMTGKSESWTDSLFNGGAAALAPIIIKSSANKLGPLFNWRTAGITSEEVLTRAGASLGPDATFAQAAKVLARSGLSKEAATLDALGEKSIASATPAEMAELSKTLKLQGARGGEALLHIMPVAEAQATDLQMSKLLGQAGVKTVGDLSANLARTAGRVSALSESVQTQLGSGALKGVRSGSPIGDVLKKLTTGSGAAGDPIRPLYSTAAAAEKEAQFLAANKITTVEQLKAAAANAPEYFSTQKLYPALKDLPAETPLSDAIGGGRQLSAQGSIGRTQLNNILTENALPPIAEDIPAMAARAAGQSARGWSGKAMDIVWGNRFYRVDSPMHFPNWSQPSELVAGEQSTLARGVSKFTPQFGLPRLSNLGRLDGSASLHDLQMASNQARTYGAFGAGVLGLGAFNSTAGLYNNWYKGNSYEGADGQWHRYTVADALYQANLGEIKDGVAMGLMSGTLGQALVGSYFFKGALPAVLEEVSSLNPKTLLEKLPIFKQMPAALRGYVGYSIGGNSANANVITQYTEASKNGEIYDSTQRPLVNYGP